MSRISDEHQAEVARLDEYCKRKGYQLVEAPASCAVCAMHKRRGCRHLPAGVLIHRPEFFDHVRWFRDQRGRLVFTSQPYCPPENYSDLVEKAWRWAEENNLYFSFSFGNGFSWYYPEHTVLIEFCAKEEI